MTIIYDRSSFGLEKKKQNDKITAKEIKEALDFAFSRYSKIFVPEFTYDAHRADAVLINIDKKEIIGFEIKVGRGDWLKDRKYHYYTRFCSMVWLVSPRGIIKKSEVKEPFGLLRISRDEYGRIKLDPIKKPKHIQTHDALAWTWTYLRVLELELRRIADALKKIPKWGTNEKAN